MLQEVSEISFLGEQIAMKRAKATWQELYREYGVTFYGCSVCSYYTALRYEKCPKCKHDMANHETPSPELDRLYEKSVWSLYWAAERKKGIVMTKGGKANETD